MRFGRMAIFATAAAATVLVAVVVATVGKTQPAPATTPVTKEHPAWTLSPQDKRTLLAGAARLKAGDTYDQVVAALGKPTYDRQLIPKESNVSHGRSLRYQAAVWEENLVNELHDEWVFVVLDTHDVVREVSIRLTVSD